VIKILQFSLLYQITLCLVIWFTVLYCPVLFSTGLHGNIIGDRYISETGRIKCKAHIFDGFKVTEDISCKNIESVTFTSNQSKNKNAAKFYEIYIVGRSSTSPIALITKRLSFITGSLKIIKYNKNNFMFGLTKERTEFIKLGGRVYRLFIANAMLSGQAHSWSLLISFTKSDIIVSFVHQDGKVSLKKLRSEIISFWNYCR